MVGGVEVVSTILPDSTAVDRGVGGDDGVSLPARTTTEDEEVAAPALPG